jgi:hypothetical protein
MQINRVMTFILFLGGFLLLPAASDPPPLAADAQQTAELRAALENRLQNTGENQLLTSDLFTPQIDAAFLSPDENSAAVWLALQEPSGRIVAAEPGLALAQNSPEGWQLLLPGDPGWETLFQSMPANLIPAELSPAPDQMELSAQTNTLTGYYLPYAAGTSHFLEGSISHFQSIPALGYPSCSEDYCHYAMTLPITTISRWWHRKKARLYPLAIPARTATRTAPTILSCAPPATKPTRFTSTWLTAPSPTS